jgi:G3E family GTPase
MKQNKIPITLLSGFLGSGKTTLVNRLLNEDHGKKIALIENEFGEIGIDTELMDLGEDAFVEMNNGCLCCTIRGDLVKILVNILDKVKDFDHIVIESTGMANPGPIVQTLLSSQDLVEDFSLNSVVTVIDSSNYYQNISLDSEEIQFQDQIAFADIILLNKIDLLKDEQIDKIMSDVKFINKSAEYYKTSNCNIFYENILTNSYYGKENFEDNLLEDTQSEYPFSWGAKYLFEKGVHEISFAHLHNNIDFSINRSKNSEKEINRSDLSLNMSLFASKPEEIFEGEQFIIGSFYKLKASSHKAKAFFNIEDKGYYTIFLGDDPDHSKFEVKNNKNINLNYFVDKKYKLQHKHNLSVSAVSMKMEGNINPHLFESFLNFILMQNSTDLYRMKGILSFPDNPNRVIMQGVYDSLTFVEGKKWEDQEFRNNRLVFIGKNLNQASIQAGVMNCVI